MKVWVSPWDWNWLAGSGHQMAWKKVKKWSGWKWKSGQYPNCMASDRGHHMTRIAPDFKCTICHGRSESQSKCEKVKVVQSKTGWLNRGESKSYCESYWKWKWLDLVSSDWRRSSSEQWTATDLKRQWKLKLKNRLKVKAQSNWKQYFHFCKIELEMWGLGYQMISWGVQHSHWTL